MTCDQDHAYTAEQKALNNGLMNAFVQNTDNESCSPPEFSAPGLVMDYYDGNTVTGLWNYAQHYAMNDNFFDTEFGPSTPGAINLISGYTGGAETVNAQGIEESDPGVVGSPNARGVAILAFIENNWLGQARVNASSFDNLAGSVTDMFNFASPNDTPVLLNPNTGEVMHG